jgi:hypothetical protein
MKRIRSLADIIDTLPMMFLDYHKNPRDKLKQKIIKRCDYVKSKLLPDDSRIQSINRLIESILINQEKYDDK